MSTLTIFEKIINRFKNNKFLVIFMLIGIIIISVGDISDSISKIRNIPFFKNVEEVVNIEVINRQLRPVYFSLEMDIQTNSSNKEKPTYIIKNKSSSLNRNSEEKLKKYSKILKELSISYTLLIEGHTSRDKLLSNNMLTDTRVEHVSKYLILLGIPSENIKTVSFGGEEWTGEYSMYAERVDFHLFRNDKSIR